MKGDVDLDLELLCDCGCWSNGDGKRITFITGKGEVPCPRCFQTGKRPTYDGQTVIELLEWHDKKKEYQRGTD